MAEQTSKKNDALVKKAIKLASDRHDEYNGFRFRNYLGKKLPPSAIDDMNTYISMYR